MSDLLITPFFHAGTGTWTYLVNRGSDAVLIDPVLDYDPRSGQLDTTSIDAVLADATARGLTIHRVLETHAHADHLSAAQIVRARNGAPVGIGEGIRAVQRHFATVFGIAQDDPALRSAFDVTYHDGDGIDAGSLHFTVLATPGHTPDSLSYRIEDNVFIGDTLFAPDVGAARCDFPGGDVDALFDSVQRFYALPDATVLWLCHDYPPQGREPRASVTVGEMKRDNRLLAGDTPRDEFARKRRERDATLPAPTLLYPSLQVNIRGGRLPEAADNGRRYLLTPLSGPT